MITTPRQDLESELQDPEYTRLYGAAEAKAELAVTLSKARVESGRTQKELAEELGRSQPYIAKLERGDANPTIGTVGSLLAMMGRRLVTGTQPLLATPVATTHVWLTGISRGATGVGILESGTLEDASWFERSYRFLYPSNRLLQRAHATGHGEANILPDHLFIVARPAADTEAPSKQPLAGCA